MPQAVKSRLTDSELDRIHRYRAQGKTAKDVLLLLNRARASRRTLPISKTPLYDFLAGEAHCRRSKEKRGRKFSIRKSHLAIYNRTRKRLQQEAENEWHMTWEDIAIEGEKELKKNKLLKRNQSGLAAESLRKTMGVE